MSSSCCLSKAVDIFGDWVIPEGIIQRKMGNFYKNNPIMSRIFVTPLAFISGTLKIFFFPLICLVGVVVMPIIALIRLCQGKRDSTDWLKAWCFCLLGLSASIAFFGVTCYYFPLVTSFGLLITFICISIILHVYKYVKEPIPLELLTTN